MKLQDFILRIMNQAFSESESKENVFKEMFTKYPSPLQSITSSVGDFSTNLPFI